MRPPLECEKQAVRGSLTAVMSRRRQGLRGVYPAFEEEHRDEQKGDAFAGRTGPRARREKNKMTTLRNKLIALAAVGILGMVGSLMNSRQAAAQGPSNGLAVRIVEPLPLPVTGSSTISGTVAATQSGAWSVGLTGNTATNPLLVRNVDDPASHPIALLIGNADSVGLYFAQWTVPATRRYVIEEFYAGCSVDTTASMTDASVRVFGGGTVTANASAAPRFIEPNGSISGHAVNLWSASAVTRLYANPGDTISFRVDDTSGSSSVRECTLSLSGYAVDVP